MTEQPRTTWSPDPVEQRAVEAVQAMLTAQAAMLFAVDGAHLVEPAGFDPAS